MKQLFYCAVGHFIVIGALQVFIVLYFTTQTPLLCLEIFTAFYKSWNINGKGVILLTV